jgi:sterol desaturase/sphingolipid hydroxylase (fatty acid hydroxylase superfamily)
MTPILDDSQLILLAITSLLFLLERVGPKRLYHLASPEAAENLVRLLLTLFLVPWLAGRLRPFLPSAFPKLSLSSVPEAVQLPAVIIGLDLLGYCSHRAFHSSRILWPLHRYHHTTTELTALSAFRHGIPEIMINSFLQSTFLSWLSPSISVTFWSMILFSTACVVQHANLTWSRSSRLDEWLITPHNHFWHHSVELLGTKGQNFGFILCFWDRAFGTHHLPAHEETRLGPAGLTDFQHGKTP